MQFRNVPLTGPRYWVALSAASIFGVNLGDFVARILVIGHCKGRPMLLVLFVAVMVVERRTRFGTEAFYWILVVIERTAATNIADLFTHDYDLNYGAVLAGLAALLVGTIALGGVVPPLSVAQASAGRGLPTGLANPRYWFAMLVAETLGTAFSDAFDDWLGLPFSIECTVLVAMFAVVFGLRTQQAFVNRLTYWLAVLVVGTCGPTAGDWLAHSGHLRLATAGTGLFFVVLLLAWPKDRPQPAASATAPFSPGV